MTDVPNPRWVRQAVPDGRPLLVHVNTTSTGGGVAELLHRLIPAQRDGGLAVGWAVVSGTPEFFALTKTIHHLLHGKGNPAPLHGADAGVLYRSVLQPQGHWLAAQLREGDTVALHDPQTLGLAPMLAARGIRVAWHCHIGTTDGSATTPEHVWRFLAPEFDDVDVVLATRPEFGPPGFTRTRYVVPPAIDPDSPKNQPLTTAEVDALLTAIGLFGTAAGGDSSATIDQVGPVPPDAPMVLQVSRWDPLKDMAGVLRCLPGIPQDAHLVLAGPDPHEVTDDPEGVAILEEVRAAYRDLPESERRRTHLVTLSMRDPHRNALLINALQRRADVVLQKSLEEGFGLTVTEAMHKSRPIVASAVGGLALQVVDGKTGLLVDPTDYTGVAGAIRRLLEDPELSRRLGSQAAAEAARLFHLSRLVADYRRVVDQPHTGKEPAAASGVRGDVTV
ncbi:glycosyltransferase [Phytohabitans houttuyneae]|uniref:Glycosyl transferase family 1 n=1 Tax=Phytohabitans houttuyneae TaxID=1076126 RepID=A0A6V8KF78_9ACTN|nr:glycosyltransferase [Phytohabitans houttuyneae]GFJ81018.1 glycosyl transferase family 1 [Phytohabitans houttuyneae]